MVEATESGTNSLPNLDKALDVAKERQDRQASEASLRERRERAIFDRSVLEKIKDIFGGQPNPMTRADIVTLCEHDLIWKERGDELTLKAGRQRIYRSIDRLAKSGELRILHGRPSMIEIASNDA